MCGIAGIVSTGDHQAEVDLMLAAIAHRGPDEFGTFTGPGVSMGTARLSIVDLAHGQQPIRDEKTGVVIVLNGEIFDFLDLRKDLVAKGHQFLTRSDTEVALRLYLEHGESFPRFLNGQFAIAIWDPRTQALLLTRDRFGICPLYYFETDGFFSFASEIKALLINRRIARKPNLRALDQIFTFWTPIGHHSAIEGINELLPGCSLIMHGRQIKVSPYWQWPFPELQVKSNLSFKEATAEFIEQLTGSIALRLQADVEVGSYLSGGIDSSAIVALACGRLLKPLKTYSVQFGEPSYDESPYQSIVADLFKTRHTAVLCQDEDIDVRFRRVIHHTECPVFRTAPTPLNILSEKVREDGIKVVLTGEGADEILLGYDIFRETKIRRFCSKFPDSKTRPQLFKRLYQYLPQFSNPRYANVAIESLKKTLNSSSPFYSHQIRWSNNAANKAYFSDNLRASLGSYNCLEEMESLMPADYFSVGDVNKAQYLETITLLRGYLLSSQGDRMMLGNSVEGRFPFLDHKMLQFTNSLPEKYKLCGLRDKHILREAMKGYLPETIVRRPKFAYQAPEIRAFFRKKNQPSVLIDQYLCDRALNGTGLFDTNLVGRLLNKIQGSELDRLGTRDNMAFVQILSTQILFEQLIKNDVRQEAVKQAERCVFKTRIYSK
jgi:asparagine synthase (glutamine-hydrolysing)